MNEQSEMDAFYESQKKIGLNMAVVMYMVGAMIYFKKQPTAFVKHVAFQIAGIGINGISPAGSGYKVSLIGDKEFTGYQLLAYYYVSWAMAIPHLLSEIALPYEKEYTTAQTFYPMFKDKEEKSMYDYFQPLNMN